MDFDVTNNGVTIAIKTQKIEKGKTAGTEYSAPDADKLTLEIAKNFLGESLLMDRVIRPTFRRVTLGIHKAALDAASDAKGNVDEEKYKEYYSKYLTSFSAVGESASVLKEALKDLMEQLGNLDDPKINIVDGAPQLDQTDANTRKYVALMLEIKRTNDALAEKKEELAEEKAAAALKAKQAGTTVAVEA
jgi:2C-methyl-D-erythritol 2,4-cyclodiphosphate synthase